MYNPSPNFTNQSPNMYPHHQFYSPQYMAMPSITQSLVVPANLYDELAMSGGPLPAPNFTIIGMIPQVQPPPQPQQIHVHFHNHAHKHNTLNVETKHYDYSKNYSNCPCGTHKSRSDCPFKHLN